MVVRHFVKKYVTFKLVINQQVIGKNDCFRQFILKKVPLVNRPFSPTMWLMGSRFQTIAASCGRSNPPFNYQREHLPLSDGGELVLDWAYSQNDKDTTLPTVIFLPGLSGISEDLYMRHCVYEIIQNGYRAVVLNYRGNAGAQLKTPLTNCAANVHDVQEVVQHVKKLYPMSPLIGAGISVGGSTLFNYCAQLGKNVPLEAAMLISVAWNADASSKSLERPLNWFLFNRTITNLLRNLIKRNEAIFSSLYDLSLVYKSKTIREFDRSITAKMFGYADVDSYYREASLAHKIDKIKVPLLCMNAADDQFVPLQSLPLDQISQSRYITLILTTRGGHNGFLEGIWPTGPNYADRVLGEFIKAIVNNIDEVRKMKLDSGDPTPLTITLPPITVANQPHQTPAPITQI